MLKPLHGRLENTGTELNETTNITSDTVLKPVYTVTLYSDGIIYDKTIEFDRYNWKVILPTSLEKDGLNFAGMV